MAGEGRVARADPRLAVDNYGTTPHAVALVRRWCAGWGGRGVGSPWVLQEVVACVRVWMCWDW